MIRSSETKEALSNEEVFKTGMDHLAESACWFFEVETPEGKAMAFMVDSLLRYGERVVKGLDILPSCNCCMVDESEQNN